MKSRKRDEIDTFKAWLTARGAEVLLPTNEYELVRFKGGGATSIIYRNKLNARTYTGQAAAAWEAYKKGDNAFRLAVSAATPQRSNESRSKPTIQTLIERDGDECFYCGDPFRTAEARTKEHLVAQTHGGPNHIANYFLACSQCNTEAGHLSAPEKIRLRDRKRGYCPKVGKATGTGLDSPAAFNSTQGDDRC